MTPDPAAIADPLERQRVALAQIEASRQDMRRWSAVRAQAVAELKQGRTWAQVAELLGVSEPTAWNIAHPRTGTGHAN